MKDKAKEIQSILNEYKLMRRKSEEVNEENIEDMQEKSVINPELSLGQLRKLNEKDLNIQVMISLIKKQEEIQEEEKIVKIKIKKIKEDIGNFRYTYDEDGKTQNAAEMQKMTQKYEKAKKESNKIKQTKSLCEDTLSDFEKKTGLTINNIKEMTLREQEKKKEYEEQERIRKEKIEKRKQQSLEAREIQQKDNQNEIEIVEEAQSEENIKENVISKIDVDKKYTTNDIITIYPYKNTASYIFEGREGKIDDIRSLIWGEDKPNIFGKYKIKEEEYELTNNNTGETKEYVSKLNPVVFEVFKTNPQKLEEYMQLKSKTAILYVFGDPQKENKDVAKMMYKYQKQDKAVTQKIGYMGLIDRINSKIFDKFGNKVLALPEANLEQENINEGLENKIEETFEIQELEIADMKSVEYPEIVESLETMQVELLEVNQNMQAENIENIEEQTVAQVEVVKISEINENAEGVKNQKNGEQKMRESSSKGKHRKTRKEIKAEKKAKKRQERKERRELLNNKNKQNENTKESISEKTKSFEEKREEFKMELQSQNIENDELSMLNKEEYVENTTFDKETEKTREI